MKVDRVLALNEQSPCLSPALQKLYSGIPVILALSRWKQENQKFKVLGFVVRSRLA